MRLKARLLTNLLFCRFVIVGLASGHVIVIPLGLKSFGDVRL